MNTEKITEQATELVNKALSQVGIAQDITFAKWDKRICVRVSLSSNVISVYVESYFFGEWNTAYLASPKVYKTERGAIARVKQLIKTYSV